MIRTLLISCTLAVACVPSFASCFKNGITAESVSLSIGGSQIEHWDTVHGKIHRIRLPSGYELGVQVDHKESL